MSTICFFVAGVYSHFPIDCFVLFCLLPEVIPYNCLSIVRLIVWIIDCVCETWDIRKYLMFSSRKYEKVGLLVIELAIMGARKNIWRILQWRIIHEQQRRRKSCFLVNYLILR